MTTNTNIQDYNFHEDHFSKFELYKCIKAIVIDYNKTRTQKINIDNSF